MKTKKRLLTFVLTLCMVLSCFTGFHASETAVQAAQKDGIYVCTFSTVDGERIVSDGDDTITTNGKGKFVYQCSLKEKGNVFFLCFKINKKNYGVIDTPFQYSGYDIMDDKIETDVLSSGRYQVAANSAIPSDGTIRVYFVPVCTELEMSTDNIDIAVGGSSDLSVTAGPSDYTKYFSSPKWTSSDESVVKVDSKGHITGVSEGTAKITAQIDEKKASCAVTVKNLGEDVNTITASKIKLSKTTYSYTGKENRPKVTVYDQNGAKLDKSTYTVTYSDNVNAGKATVTVNVKQSIVKGSVVNAATLTKTFKIKAAKAKSVKLSKTSYTYKYKKNGLRPKVTVYDSKGKKISSKEYTVAYKNNNQGGTAKVIVKMSKNYGSKKFTKTFTIKYDAKTNALLPSKKTFTAIKRNAGTKDVLYYTKQSAEDIKRILPYGGLDVAFDEIYTFVPFLNEKAFFPNEKNGASIRSSYVDDNCKYTSGKFTGSISDLIQCVIHSPIVRIEDESYEYGNLYQVVCKDGCEYSIQYASAAGLQYGKYSLFRISSYRKNDDGNSDVCEYFALFAIDKSKTSWK